MQSNYYTTDSDAGVDSGSEKEVGLGNSYGAAGSSTMMSDSELLKLRALAFKRPVGRPIQNRKKGFLETYGKKRKRKSDNDFGIGTRAPIINNEKPNQKKKIRCSECQILGHNATKCRKKHVDLNTEIPEF
jgi:ribosomal protein L44E